MSFCRKILVIQFIHLSISTTHFFFTRDILRDLAEAGKLPLPDSSLPISKKRHWGSDAPFLPSTTADGILGPDRDRPKARLRRFSSASSPNSQNSSPSPRPFPHVFDNAGSLPMHTAELGKLPLHRGVNYPTSLSFDDIKGESWSPMSSSFQPLQPSCQILSSRAVSSAGSGNDQGTAFTWACPTVNPEFGGMMESGHAGSFATSSAGFDLSSFGIQRQSQALQQPPVHPWQPAPMFTPQVVESAVNTEPPELLEILFQQPAQSPTQQQEQVYDSNAEAYMHSDTLQMWSNAPSGFESVFSAQVLLSLTHRLTPQSERLV
jgi:hypothetical protein